MAAVYIEDIEIGMWRARRKRVTRDDIAAFGELSGDQNPLHFDDAYAAETRFGRVVAHGMLSAGLISAVLGEDLPGHGAVYLEQTLRFRAPVRPGDEVEARCTVVDILRERRRVNLECVCQVGDMVVLDGVATVLAPRRSAAAPRRDAA